MNAAEDVKIDSKHRATLHPYARPGEHYAVENPDDGVIVLRRREMSRGRPKEERVRRKGRTLLLSDHVLTNEDVQRMMETFP